MIDVTPLIITYNEAPNIGRTLARLTWAKRIVVIDSGSTDGTIGIAQRHPQVEILHRPFDSFAEQCNFGLQQITGGWVLSLDADYELSAAAEAELQALAPSEEVQGYQAHFIYRIWGKPLHGTLYPPRTVLYRAGAGRYLSEGHAHKLAISGPVAQLAHPIYHDDRKPLSRWFDSQRRYAAAEAAYLLRTPHDQLNAVDRVRLTGWLAPMLVLPYVLLAKGCLLDGRAGWFYALQRLLAEIMVGLELLDRRLQPANDLDA